MATYQAFEPVPLKQETENFHLPVISTLSNDKAMVSNYAKALIPKLELQPNES